MNLTARFARRVTTVTLLAAAAAAALSGTALSGRPRPGGRVRPGQGRRRGAGQVQGRVAELAVGQARLAARLRAVRQEAAAPTSWPPATAARAGAWPARSRPRSAPTPRRPMSGWTRSASPPRRWAGPTARRCTGPPMAASPGWRSPSPVTAIRSWPWPTARRRTTRWSRRVRSSPSSARASSSRFWRTSSLTGTSWTRIPASLPINESASLSAFGKTVYVVDPGLPGRLLASTDGRHFAARPSPCQAAQDFGLIQAVPTSASHVALLCDGNPGFSKASRPSTAR